jgi:hypothetical protein
MSNCDLVGFAIDIGTSSAGFSAGVKGTFFTAAIVASFSVRGKSVSDPPPRLGRRIVEQGIRGPSAPRLIFALYSFVPARIGDLD